MSTIRPLVSPKKDPQHEPIHPSKSAQDRMPVERRPRVIAAQERAEKMRRGEH